MNVTRISLDSWALSLAMTTASRSTCRRRQVGCVLLNEFGHVMATGYNGPARHAPHCGEFGSTCELNNPQSGTNLDSCDAIHAEQNALLQCTDVNKIHTCYVTTSPCVTCLKMLLNTSCQRIVFINEYPHSRAKELWVAALRTWDKKDPYEYQ